MNLDERWSLLEPPEFRSDNGKLVAAGVAMKYGAKSKPLRGGQFREVFNPGAFTKALQEADVRSYCEHDGPYLGRMSNGTLRLTDSRSELAYEIDLPNTSAGRDAAALLERGDIKGSSVAFRSAAKDEKWSVDEQGMSLRSVNTAHLFRVDLTVAPAYPDSTAEAAYRSLVYQTGRDLKELMDAAEKGQLAALITAAEAAEGEDRSDVEDGRETTVVVRHPTYY